MMMKLHLVSRRAFVLLLLRCGVASAVATTQQAKQALRRALEVPGRREVLGGVGASLLALAEVERVDASGGATAGGAYLLRAKERYNARVVAGAKDFKATLGTTADSKAIAELFAKDGTYDDLTAAAFLLSNAFRINSTQNPDRIPQVQKFKKFKAAADAIPAAAKKKKDLTDLVSNADDLLDVYLQSVDLAL
mmetsp:Transcript_28216/g.90940  ORF Transcript_28216/g.90940 Transcript_28216/m.90940 type:complete len:193 (+) Transcript_28216:16-594(+)